MKTKSRFHLQLFTLVLAMTALGSGPSVSEANDLHIGGATTSITPDLPVALSGQMHTRVAKQRMQQTHRYTTPGKKTAPKHLQGVYCSRRNVYVRSCHVLDCGMEG